MPRRVYRPYGQPKSKAQQDREYNRFRRDPEAQRFYQSSAWRKLRAEKVAIDPLCEPCKAQGRYRPTQEVHHRLDRRNHPELELDLDNLESVCIACHNRKRDKA